jgi:hypothetical protein
MLSLIDQMSFEQEILTIITVILWFVVTGHGQIESANLSQMAVAVLNLFLNTRSSVPLCQMSRTPMDLEFRVNAVLKLKQGLLFL